MNVTLRQLRAFVALAQTGSFTEAAARLHITQSALSGLIKELETVLGVQVVQRSTRKVGLTEVGREFHPLAQRLLQDLDGALDTIADLKNLKRGLVRVAAPQLMAAAVMPELIAQFRETHPDVEVRLIDCLAEQLGPKLHGGEVDFVVGPERDVTPELDTVVLFETPFVVVFPANHPLQKKRRVTWAQALQYPVVALKGEYTHRLRMDLQGAVPQESLNPVKEVAFMTTALAMVAAGLGVTTCLPYAANQIRLYGLHSRALTPEVRRRFYLYMRKDRPLSPAARAFSEFLLARVQQQTWFAPARSASHHRH